MQKSILAAALAASCAAPLHAQASGAAAHMNGAGPVSMGSFAGARVRISLGGAKGEKRAVRAGLTVAPMQRSSGSDLKGLAWRIGEGLEFGLRSDEPEPLVSLAGQRLTPVRYAPGRSMPAKGRNNLSDAGVVAVVVGGLAVLGGIGLLVALDASDDPDRCCE